MYKTLIIFFLFLIVAKLYCQVQLRRDQRGPIMEILQDTIDAGIITEGEIITEKFIVKNVGTDSLRIFNIENNCGCTTTIIGKSIIPTGQSSQISVTFNSYKKLGNQLIRTLLYTNSEYKPGRLLYLKVYVKSKETK